jgi:hypothetical protein
MNDERLERIRTAAKEATPAEMFITEYDGAIVDPRDVLDLVTEVKRLKRQKERWKPKMQESIAKYLDQREKAIQRAHAAEAEIRGLHDRIGGLIDDLAAPSASDGHGMRAPVDPDWIARRLRALLADPGDGHTHAHTGGDEGRGGA